MIHSMTAFASRTSGTAGASWVWEVRSVNARGLDLRLRLPDGIDGLEADIRKQFGAKLKRGNVSLSLRVSHDASADTLALDEAHLDRVLKALDDIQDRASAAGVTLAQPTAADVLNHRGVILQSQSAGPDEALVAALKSDIAPLLDDLMTMRAQEGAVLATYIAEQIERIGDLVVQAEEGVVERRPVAAAALKAAMERVLEETAAEPERLVQELAVLAVKTDVTEEIDRLKAHVTAAQELLKTGQSADGPIGRKLDFLCQEFNREANTLCAKAQYPKLTAVGLELKTVIDQMREQIQNVE